MFNINQENETELMFTELITDNLKYLPKASLEFYSLSSYIISLLVLFTVIFQVIKKVKPIKAIENLIDRVNSWWIIFIFIMAILLTPIEIAFSGFAFISFIALRELVSQINLRIEVRRTIFWAFLAIPVQFYLAYKQLFIPFLTFIPVVMFILLPLRTIILGETKDAIKTFSTLHWALMLTVFSLSHIAYILSLPVVPGFTAGNESIILYLIFITQFNDVLQYLWGKALGRRQLSPHVSPNKTWAGAIGGVVTSTVLGYYLSFMVPLSEIQSAIAAFLIASSGILGDLNISAIKRDLNLKDMGSFIPGHGGVMDRIDSLSYSSLIFFHILFYWIYD